MKENYKIENVSLKLIFYVILKQLRWFVAITLIECFVLICFGAIKESIMFCLLLFLGLLGSYSIHEYMHILMMKKSDVSDVVIGSTFFKISIIPNKTLKGKELIIVAVSGPVVCGIVGGVIAMINLFVGVFFLRFMALIYCFHLINLLPVFGDGKMFIKGLFT